ncbi:MAG TPA: Mur ligase family protein [Chitinispirillaceae bacterium]|nr:Mur ligase family protein [Chitinispirillaceae bacterium]
MSILINNKNCSNIHFTGIFGSGMSAIAQYLRWNGLEISGSDRMYKSKDTEEIANKLLDTGCSLYPQNGSAITENTDIICISSAIEDSNPDILSAKSHGIQIVHRSDLLSAIVSSKKTVAVAGTSGKSTVTAMIFEFMTHCGLNPSLISGANLLSLEKKGLIGNAYKGKSRYLIIEADESDGSLIKYKPFISLFLNVSKDHKTVPEVVTLFNKLANQSVVSIINADDPNLTNIKKTLTFSLNSEADWTPQQIDSNPLSFQFVHDNSHFVLPLPGLHNLSNCAAALCTCEYLSCNEQKLEAAVKNFQGVARRFSINKTRHGITVIDDFAHNPEKIKAAINAARGISNTLFVIYQPHGYGPTRFLKNEYIEVFQKCLANSDSLYLLPIYYAGGTAQKDISSQDLINELNKNSFKACAPADRDSVLNSIKTTAQQGDCILLMGARDPTLPSFASDLVKLFGGKIITT